MTSERADGSGRRLGRYHLGDTLGGGPTGVVYRAKVFGVAGFERRFAIKRFHDELVRSPSMAARVAGAARIYGSLEHPHLARLHEFGVASGQTFTATELVDGLDLGYLSSSIRGGVKPGSAAAALALAARAVGFGHGRGHCHLGICPTNVILTNEGSLKVTDFGLLIPRLPKRPAQDPTLDARIPFLAPEQLAGEPTSAATDVYQLGVIGYILFVGQPPFSGTTAYDVAQQIMSARAPEPVLARPVAKVLKRCLARSPFERYPDASALADAIEEAAHEAALPGSMNDLRTLVEAELTRRNQIPLEDQRLPQPAPPQSGMKPNRTPMPRRVVRGAGLSKDALKKTMMGVTPRPVLKRPAAPKRALPPPAGAPKRADSQADTKINPTPLAAEDLIADSIDLGPAGGAGAHVADVLAPGGGSRVAQIPMEVELGKSGSYIAQTGADERAVTPGEEIMCVDPGLEPAVSIEAADEEDFETELFSGKSQPTEVTLPPVSRSPIVAPPRPLEPAYTPQPKPPVPRPAPPRVPVAAPAPVASMAPGRPQAAPPPHDPYPPAGLSDIPTVKKKSSKGLLIAAVAAALLGGGGFAVYTLFIANGGDDSTVAAGKGQNDTDKAGGGDTDKAGGGDTDKAGGSDTDKAGGSVTDAGAAVPDQKSDTDAGAAVPDQKNDTDAGAAVPDGDATELTLESTPEGAKIYLDGSEIGKTPHSMPATADKHRLALILAGHKLHLDEIEGRGKIAVTLEEVTPSGGPGGIKVRCKKKNRYYVFVDGKDAGMVCPTERITVSKGEHVVEIYDPVTESRSQFKANVTKTNRSHRVYVD